LVKERSIKFGKVLTALMWLGSLSACVDQQLPLNSDLSIFPDQKHIEIDPTTTLTDGVCHSINSTFQDIPIQVFLSDGFGSPLGGVAVKVFLDWPNHDNQGNFVRLMYDFNGDGVVDPISEIVANTDQGQVWVTESFSGTVSLILRVNTSCTHRGELIAMVGGLYKSSMFEISDERPSPEPQDTEIPHTPAVESQLYPFSQRVRSES